MFKNKLNYTLLFLHLFMLNGLLFSYSSFAADQPVQVCMSPNSIEDQDRETNLVYRINRLNLDTDRFINEINDLESEMKMYGEKIDLINETAINMATPLVPYSSEWLKIFPSIAEKPAVVDVAVTLLENYRIPRTGMKVGDVPLPEIRENKKTGEKEVSVSQALLKLTHVYEAVTPSRIADWITGTSLAIAEAREVAIESQAQAALTLSKYLREVRQRCEQVNKKEKERLAKEKERLAQISSNSQESKIPMESDTEIPNDFMKNTLQDVAVIPNPKEISFANILNSKSYGTFYLFETNKERLLEKIDKGFSNLVGIPICSFIAGPTVRSDSSSPVWYSFMPYLATPLNISQAFNGNLTEIKILHEDSIQVAYSANFNTRDKNTRGRLDITLFKDQELSSQHLKYMSNEAIKYFPEPVDRATIRCNF